MQPPPKPALSLHFPKKLAEAGSLPGSLPALSPPIRTEQVCTPSQDPLTGGAAAAHRLSYHCAPVVEVMLVLVGVGTEVHAGRDP